MTTGVGSTTTGTTTNRYGASTTETQPAQPTEETQQTDPRITEIETDGMGDTAAEGADEWATFTDTSNTAPANGQMPDLSASTLASTPAIEGGEMLGSLSPTGEAAPVESAESAESVEPAAALDSIVGEAQQAGSPEEVDALIAREQETLNGVYASLEGATEEERLSTIGQLSELSELAGPEGQEALASGLVSEMDLENGNAEINNGIMRGLENAVFEGHGATLSVNVTSQLLERPELGATDLGTRTALGTTSAVGALRSNLEDATANYEDGLREIDRQIESEGLTGEAAEARRVELMSSPDMQARDAALFDASERYRSVQQGAKAALESNSIGRTNSSFTMGLVDESKRAVDSETLSRADGLRTEVGATLAAGGVVGAGTFGLPPGSPPPKMADRHVLENMNFHKAVKDGPASGNSYLLKRPSSTELTALYGEAWNKLQGPTGTVTLSNGQVWSLDKNTGKFFPVEGPGIVKLSQQEVRLLGTLSKQVKSGVAPAQALDNLGRAMGGQKYTVTPQLQSALETLGPKLGYSIDDLGRAVAPHLPPSATAAVPDEARAAADAFAGGRPHRFVRWGGRLLLVVGVAADAYNVYTAENKPKELARVAGAWGASLAASAGAAELASPLLAGGIPGAIGYGVVVLGAGVGGYFAGGEAAETLYEWTFE